MKEETGLTIKSPRLCGVKQFSIEGSRYIVFLFETNKIEGDIADSDDCKEIIWNDGFVNLNSKSIVPIIPS